MSRSEHESEIWLSRDNRLVDGGIASAPELGVFGLDGELLIENHGAEPDIVVDNGPHATFNGEDAQLARGVALATAASWPKPQASLLWTLLARPQQRALTSRGCLDPAGYLDRLSAQALAHWETWEKPAKGSTGLRPPQPARSCSPLLAERALSAVLLPTLT